jgi:hypothetical protein
MLTGTGFTTPPSTNHLFLNNSGGNKPGIAQDAFTASITEPVVKSTSRPLYKSVATAANGLFNSSKDSKLKLSCSALNTFKPLTKPPL